MDINQLRKKRAKNLSLLDSKDTLEKLARSSGVRWYGHVLRSVEKSVGF